MLIQDLFKILPKTNRNASEGKEKGKYPFFTSSNVLDKFVDEADFNGEYLIVGDGGSGNSKYFNGSFSVSNHNYVLEPNSGTNAKAVSYFFQRNNYYILNKGFKGSGIKNVSKKYIQSINYKFNEKIGEARIVQNLDFLANTINKDIKNLNLLDEIIKSRFIGI